MATLTLTHDSNTGNTVTLVSIFFLIFSSSHSHSLPLTISMWEYKIEVSHDGNQHSTRNRNEAV